MLKNIIGRPEGDGHRSMSTNLNTPLALGRCKKEIQRRITLGKGAMQGLEKTCEFADKTRIVNAMIFLVILYGCKTREMEKKIEASEMWIWRKMLRISLTEKRTNESILMEIGQARGDLSLRQRAAKQKMMFFGHVCEQMVWKRIRCWYAVREEEREADRERGGWRNYTRCQG